MINVAALGIDQRLVITDLIYDVINYMNANNSTYIISFIDYEKAFDTVKCELLIDCLKALKFRENCIKSMIMLYNN